MGIATQGGLDVESQLGLCKETPMSFPLIHKETASSVATQIWAETGVQAAKTVLLGMNKKASAKNKISFLFKLEPPVQTPKRVFTHFINNDDRFHTSGPPDT